MVTVDPALLPAVVGPTRLGEALSALAAAAWAVVRRFGGDVDDLWPIIAVITHRRLLAPAPPI